ncbi:hypothetical protein PTSG_01156 [Salpingoeca rosetta]|uniref:HMG box domain-containing protein n=1 Tax=Salpingoeca rosetta (strain ATCC 50818 / BSB-021) TaxID=946362 RepID=F2U0Z0_SALR5|nr:uncharacterized protein PTSG_01156 [Salpingoeca rosetta]EGD80564.1 hypothetical protein PTSG_01156 [Salpingoeca rosetta]|eukprot:XP_004997125.1 hypothetical protein PTSG_01156 [Salpingoeca rosetta]
MAEEAAAAPMLRPVHGDGVTLVTFDGSGNIVTAGENAVVHVFKSTTDEDARVIEDNTGPIAAIDCKGNKLVTACEDHHVRLFDLSKGEECLESVVTRFQGPVKAVALNNTGSACASAGMDMVIKIVTLVDMSVRELHGSEGTVRSLCFDPQMELLASAGEDGYLRLWTIATGKIAHELYVLPNIRGGADPAEIGMYGIDFDPKGNMLAVPVKNAVQIFDRSLEFMFILKDLGHDAPVSVVKWSRDGRYLASVSVDGQMLVWELSSRQCVASFRHPRRLCITSIAWHPTEEEIAYADLLGNFSVWRKPVRESVKEKLTPEEVKQMEADKKEAASRADVETLFDDEPKQKIRLKRNNAPRNMITDSDDDEDYLDENDNDDFIVDDTAGAHQQHAYAPVASQFVQPAFQPASTPLEESKRFLVWNDTGFILSREEETTCAIDVEFHNASKHRPIRLVDHFGFTMGALTSSLVALAAPSHAPTAESQRDHPSVLFARNIGHWSSDETWQLFFPVGEEIECIAVGSGETSFIAAATNKNYIRLYSNNGVVLDVFCIDGPVVTMAAHENKLMIIHHSAAGVKSNQHMRAVVLDVDAKSVVCRTNVPLTDGSQLVWAGFSDTGLPAIVDSEEVVRALVPSWGFSWIPVAEFKQLRDEKHKHEYYWVTGLSDNEIVCIICRGGETYPKVLPRPVVSTVPLQMPIVSAPETAPSEEKFLRTKIFVDHLIESEELDELDRADRKLIQHHRRQLDQHVLASISRSVQSQRWGRALDLTTRLLLPGSYDIAIKLAMKAKSPMLAERMSLAKTALQTSERERLRLKVQAARAPRAPVTNVTSPLPSLSSVTAPRARSPANAPSFSPGTAPRTTHELEMSSPASTAATPDKAAARSRDKETSKFANAFQNVPLSPKKKPTSASKPKLSNPFSKKRASSSGTDAPATTATADAGAKSSNPIDALNDLARTSPKKKAKVSSPFSAKAPRALNPPAKQSKPKKPVSGYLLWLKENRKDIIQQFPELKPKEVVKKAGEIWRTLSPEEKSKYARPATSEKKPAPASAPSSRSDSDDSDDDEEESEKTSTTANNKNTKENANGVEDEQSQQEPETASTAPLASAA